MGFFYSLVRQHRRVRDLPVLPALVFANMAPVLVGTARKTRLPALRTKVKAEHGADLLGCIRPATYSGSLRNHFHCTVGLRFRFS